MQATTSPNHLMILGTRGIPARHGGFETFAEHLALYLVDCGWHVTVYCQVPEHSLFHETEWKGIRRVHIPATKGVRGTISFDWRATLDACSQPGLILTLGYNTGIFLAWYKLHGRRNLINMDGIEWKRSKWSWPARIWLYCNERIATWFGSHLIADNPGIAAHLTRHAASERVTMIPYGAPGIDAADAELLQQFDLLPGSYILLVARSEPENSILEIVRAFTRRPRGCKLVILGKYEPKTVPYHRQVIQAANAEVVMPGAVYDIRLLSALRFHARLYVHGHQVGGTNPSLVEALGAGNPVLAHDNQFNRWVVGAAGRFFSDVESCAQQFDQLLNDDALLSELHLAAVEQHRARFQWNTVLQEYEGLLALWHPQPAKLTQPVSDMELGET